VIISAELNREEIANSVLGNNSTSAIVESLLMNGKSITKIKVKKYGTAYLKIWLEQDEEKKYSPTIKAEARGGIEFEHEQTLYDEETNYYDYYLALKDAVDGIIEDVVDEISHSTTTWGLFESEYNRQPKKRKWYMFWRR
jgi:hypothetical protein